MTLAFLDVSSKKGAYRDISHIILKYSQISNKLILKVSAKKKGGKGYVGYKYVFIFR